MKLKKLLTVFVAGIMAFITTSYVEGGNSVLGGASLKQVKNCLNCVYSAVLVQGENTIVGIKYWLINYNLQWGNGNDIAINLNNKMLSGINESQAICQKSGILLKTNKFIVNTRLNDKLYRGSG